MVFLIKGRNHLTWLFCGKQDFHFAKLSYIFIKFPHDSYFNWFYLKKNLLYFLKLSQIILRLQEVLWSQNSAIVHTYSLVVYEIALCSTWDRNYSPNNCPRGIVFVEGWIKELFHSQPVNNCFTVLYWSLYTLNNSCMIISLYLL